MTATERIHGQYAFMQAQRRSHQESPTPRLHEDQYRQARSQLERRNAGSAMTEAELLVAFLRRKNLLGEAASYLEEFCAELDADRRRQLAMYRRKEAT